MKVLIPAGRGWRVLSGCSGALASLASDRIPLDTLGDWPAPSDGDPVDLIALDTAMARLSRQNERQARTAELRYFGGLSVRETAEVLGVSEITVKRDWRFAKAWLYREMDSGTNSERRA